MKVTCATLKTEIVTR